jgi:hypothetical protein
VLSDAVKHFERQKARLREGITLGLYFAVALALTAILGGLPILGVAGTLALATTALVGAWHATSRYTGLIQSSTSSTTTASTLNSESAEAKTRCSLALLVEHPPLSAFADRERARNSASSLSKWTR